MNLKKTELLSTPNLYLIVVLCLTAIAFQYWSDGIRSLSIAIGFILPFMVCNSYFSCKQFSWMLFYFIIVMLNSFTGDVYFSQTYGMVMNAAGLFISSSLTYFVLNKNKYDLLNWIVFIVFFVIVWMAVATAYFDISNPGIVRFAVNMHREGDDSLIRPMYRLGMSDYASPHAIPILIPPLIYGIKKSVSKLRKIFFFLILVSCFMLVYFSGATGPMIVSIIIIAISFLVRSDSLSTNALLFALLIIILPFIINDSLMLGLLDLFDNLVGGEGFFHNKIADFQDTIIYGESTGSVEERMDVYQQTSDLLSGYIIWGTQTGTGGHSVLLDRLASLGLLGFIPFVGMLVVEGKYMKRFIPSQSNIYYILSWVAALIMMSIKNHSGWHMWFYLFTVLPFILIVVEQSSRGRESRQFKRK